jgi:hypothetical protein
MGMYLPKKYEHQFYCSRLNPYSGKAVNSKKIISQLSASDVTRVISLDTHSQA